MAAHERAQLAAGAAELPSVFLTGMFDMRNFGDLLFPLIAAYRLRAHGIAVVPVSATGNATGLADASPSLAMADLLVPGARPRGMTRGMTRGMVIGGGYLLHTHRLDVLEEYRAGDVGAWAGPSLWLGAIFAAAMLDVPVVLNAPGAPHPVGARHRRLVARALAAADYVSLRDEGSRAMLPLEGVEAAVVPDTALDIARMWPRPVLEEAYRALLARKSVAGGARLMAIHVRERSTRGHSLDELAAGIDSFAAPRGLVPMLLGVGTSHGDDRFARALAARLPGRSMVLDDSLGLKEITAAIAHSAVYLGSSMHGYVAAAAYGVPAALVAKPAYRKFAGLLDHLDRRSLLAHDWTEAFATAAGALAAPPPQLPRRVLAALDAHWAALAAAIVAGPERRRAARLDFLREVVAAGCAEDGVGWAMLPFTGHAARARAAAGDDVRGMAPF